MPRTLRQEYPGAVYHAMCRGNEGQDIFVKEDGCRLFLSTLGEVCRQTGWRIHAYVLMSNHYHMLLETPESNLVAGMKWFQGTFTQRFNAMFGRRGHLYQGRYKALPVEVASGSYFREVGQYIHLNPFRAGLAGLGKVKALESYVWSSYPAYVDDGKERPEWLERERLFAACALSEGGSNHPFQYRALIQSRMLGELDSVTGAERELVEKQLKRGWYIGGSSFRGELIEMISGDSDNLRGQQRRGHNEGEAERLLQRALYVLGLTEQDLLTMKSTQPEKQAIVWLLKTNTPVTAVWITSRLSMGHRTNASRAISAFKQAESPEYKLLQKKMLQCTG